MIVEAKSIESIKKQWGEINSAVDYYCSNDEPADDMDEDGTIEDTDIKVVFDIIDNLRDSGYFCKECTTEHNSTILSEKSKQELFLLLTNKINSLKKYNEKDIQRIIKLQDKIRNKKKDNLNKEVFNKLNFEKSNLIISSGDNYSLIYVCKIEFDKDELKEYVINITYNDEISERFQELIKSLKNKYNLVIH